MSILPASRPDVSVTNALAWLPAGAPRDVLLIGRRGYYRDTMGEVGENDRGLYDDAIVLVTPTCYETFNANTDPSKARDGIATLVAGVWSYKIGIHGLSKPKAKQYEALVQAGPVTVLRDGGATDTGWFGINVHRGGYSTTGSEGCQTIHPDQWSEFIALVKNEMRKHGHATIPYVLTVRAGA